MSKFRSRVNYADIYNSDNQGYNVGLDAGIYLREEAIPRTFQLPRIGTQGNSVSDVSASTDISAGSNTTLKLNVSGKGIVVVTLTLAGLSTGAAIAAALETTANAALAAAGFDERVWVDFDGGAPDQYTVTNQFTGIGSTVVITDGDSNNVATDLKLGTGNGGAENDGTDDQDKLLYTTGGPTFSQPVESNTHRNGRYHGGIIRKKKVCEFDMDTFVNMSGSGGASIDQTIKLLLSAIFGTETENAGVSTVYTQGLPTKYFSMVRVSTVFGEYYNGAYASNLEMEFPGDGPATMKFVGKASDASIAGVAKVSALVSASTTIPLTDTEESERYTVGSFVMALDTDGRTILYGEAGDLTVAGVNDGSNELTLSSPVDLSNGSYIVPWDPGAVQQTSKDAIATDLVGSFKWDYPAGSEICSITSMSFSASNDHNDLDNRFGKDANQGYIPGNRLTMNLSVTFDLSSKESLGKVVRSRNFDGFKPEIILGDVASGRYLRIRSDRWIPSVPALDVPENGPTPVTLEGTLYESTAGARDPVSFGFF